MKTKYLKQEIARYTAALSDLNQGGTRLAVQAIQLGELSVEQLRRGLVSRLSYAVASARGRRIPKAEINLAQQALDAA